MGWRVILTQGFKSTAMAEWHKLQGRNWPEHLAVDVVIGTPEYSQWATYGAQIVCPFPEAKMINREVGGDPGSQKGGRFQISYTPPGQTAEIIMGGVHCSEIIDKETFKEGEVVAYIGNNGYVNPPPTPAEAYAGGHLHLSYTLREPGQNGIPHDPLEIFNIYEPFRGKDSGFEKDITPIAWAMGWSKEKINEILNMVKKAMSTGGT